MVHVGHGNCLRNRRSSGLTNTMPYVLRFIAGQFEGGEFPLKPNREIIIGRSSEYDMVLDEERVSRCHAKIFTFNGEVVVKDQGSTNGTFLNGQRIDEATLKVGDRLLVGASVMEFASLEQESRTAEDKDSASRGSGQGNVRATVSMSQQMRGCFPEDAELTDILTFWTHARRSGVLHVESDGGDFADLYFDGGVMNGVRLKMADSEGFCIGGRKSFFRVISWAGGVYSFQSAHTDHEGRCELTEETAILLALSVDQRDEFKALAAHVPPRSARFVVEAPLESPLSDLSVEALDTFQAVYNLGLVGQVLDASESTDLETCTDLLYLQQNGYIKAT